MLSSMSCPMRCISSFMTTPLVISFVLRNPSRPNWKWGSTSSRCGLPSKVQCCGMLFNGVGGNECDPTGFIKLGDARADDGVECLWASTIRAISGNVRPQRAHEVCRPSRWWQPQGSGARRAPRSRLRPAESPPVTPPLPPPPRPTPRQLAPPLGPLGGESKACKKSSTTRRVVARQRGAHAAMSSPGTSSNGSQPRTSLWLLEFPAAAATAAAASE
mmetsp:Transcript_56902/g.164905  ORF Transcript_56902/g.164905 Transcript_56902/m.164905 type:complete len:217 (+) Transcript_56902:281-931(+)